MLADCLRLGKRRRIHEPSSEQINDDQIHEKITQSPRFFKTTELPDKLQRRLIVQIIMEDRYGEANRVKSPYFQKEQNLIKLIIVWAWRRERIEDNKGKISERGGKSGNGVVHEKNPWGDQARGEKKRGYYQLRRKVEFLCLFATRVHRKRRGNYSPKLLKSLSYYEAQIKAKKA